MDSGGSSSSMQSSSGGEDQSEYDSRAADSQISPNFLFNPPSSSTSSSSSSHFLSISTTHQQHPPPPPLSLLRGQNSSFLDVPAAVPQPLDPFSQSAAANPRYNLDFVSSRGLRSADFANTGGLSTSPSTSSPGAAHHHQGALLDPNGLGPVPYPGATASRPDHQLGKPGKNPKKRTRASRRAPTTVLTTDISNFRQMVQEFTGIPIAPFSASGGGSPYSRRFDLFGPGSNVRHHNSDAMGPSLYLRQPSVPSLFGSSAANIDRSNSNTFGSAANSNSYQLPLDISIQKQQRQQQQNNSSASNLQQMQTFQSLLQSPIPPTLFKNSPVFNVKQSQEGSSGAFVNNPSSLGNYNLMGSKNSDAADPTHEGTTMNYGEDHHHRHHHHHHHHNQQQHQQQQQQQLGSSLSGSNNGITTTHARGYMSNCTSPPTSDFHPEKGLENF